ncbi:MAG: RND family efflux transporter MFP subunit [Paracoccaceae bacterium]|jgi:RND family efflux transporter MFP subunit
MLSRFPPALVSLVLLLPATSHAAPFDCVIQPKAMIGIVAADRGRIDRILVGRGDIVKAGEPVLQLESVVQRLQVELYRKRMESDVEVRANKAEVERNKVAFTRASELASRNVGTTSAVEDAGIQLVLSEFGVEQAIAARKLAEIELEQAQELLDRRTIVSPVDGIVTSVMSAPGEYAHEQLEIVEIAQIDPLHVEVFVTPEYYNKIAISDRYLVGQVAPLNGRYPARVTVIDRIFDAASNTFGVRLELENPGGTIPAGIRCWVDFDTQIPE